MSHALSHRIQNRPRILEYAEAKGALVGQFRHLYIGIFILRS